MSIHIMRDGRKIGPFSEEAARVLLEQGDVEEEDLACREGAAEWEPLGEVLKTPSSAPAAPTSGYGAEPPTPAQMAFLSYFGIATPPGLLREAAGQIIAGAAADPQSAQRLAAWQIERLRLHPDLFAAEALATKENRAQFFFDLCQTAGADYFTGVTKAHCQVLVAFLDVKFPRWDAHGAEAAERYFFPAIAEKFPQLVNKAWRGRLRYGEGPAAVKATRKLRTAKLARRPDLPLRAVMRGLVLGLCILGVLYLAHRVM